MSPFRQQNTPNTTSKKDSLWVFKRREEPAVGEQSRSSWLLTHTNLDR